MVKCPKCGNEAHDNPYCANCGTKIEKEIICPECNQKLDESSAFCPNCGTKLDDSGEEKNKDNEDEASKEETEDKKETSQEEETDKKDKEDKKEEPKEEIKETTSNTDDSEKKYCAFCNTEIDDETDFCPECGKSVNIDKQSMSGIRNTINFKNLILCSIISIILSVFISLIFCYLFGRIPGDYYPLGFIISLVISIGIFGSFKDIINGGLLGIITGLVLGLLANYIVELSSGFAFSYEMLFGYSAVIFTIFGLIMGIIATGLRKHVVKFIDVEKILK